MSRGQAERLGFQVLLEPSDAHLAADPALLVATERRIRTGVVETEAVETCVLAPLTSDGAISDGLREVASTTLNNGRRS